MKKSMRRPKRLPAERAVCGSQFFGPKHAPMKIMPIIHTLGGSEVTQVFVHDVTSAVDISELKAVFPGYRAGYCDYDQRALLLARSHDIVCVLGKMDQDFVRFISDLRLGPQREHIVELGVEGGNDDSGLSKSLIRQTRALETIRTLIPSHNRVMLNPFYLSECETLLADKLANILGKPVSVWGGNQHIVAIANRKDRVYVKAHELRVLLAPGEVVELQGSSLSALDLTPLRRAVDRQLDQTGSVIIRGTNGASGSQTFTITSDDRRKTMSTLLKGRHFSRVYLVQVLYDIVTSPNIQMFVSPDTGLVSCVAVTDQQLDKDLAHLGNVLPSNAARLPDIIHSAETIASWLKSEGYRGLVGLDFVEYIHPTTGKLEYFLAEINARINAASYACFLMEHVNSGQAAHGGPLIGAFLATSIKTTAKSFEELRRRCGHMFFDRQMGRGVIPFNIGCLSEGRCSLAFLGSSRSEVEHMSKVFSALELKSGDGDL